MRLARLQRSVLVILGLSCLLPSGCSTICELARRTTIIEPTIFYWKDDKARSLAVYSSWADAAWAEELPGCPQAGGRPDYGLGFRDGFVDYVYAGGTGEPPPVPPRYLWNVENRSPEGRRRSEDWFAGYRHGARVARNGGYRSLATIQAGFNADYYDETHHGGNNWQFNGQPSQDDWQTTEPLPAPTEPAPVEAAPQPPDEPQPPRLTTPNGKASTESHDDNAPQTTPVVPPAPRNLPPTTPRPVPSVEAGQHDAPPPDPGQLDLPPDESMPPTLPASPGVEPKPSATDAPVNELRTTDPFESEPGPAPPGELNHPAPVDGGSESEPKASSLRIVVPLANAGTVPREPRRMSSQPAGRAKPLPPRSTTAPRSAIRLTSATPDSAPAATKIPVTLNSTESTIRIRAGSTVSPARPPCRPVAADAPPHK